MRWPEVDWADSLPGRFFGGGAKTFLRRGLKEARKRELAGPQPGPGFDSPERQKLDLPPQGGECSTVSGCRLSLCFQTNLRRFLSVEALFEFVLTSFLDRYYLY